MTIYSAIEELLDYGERRRLFEKEDRIYCRNLVLDVLQLDAMEDAEHTGKLELQTILGVILDYACQNGLIEDSVTYRDLFDTELARQGLEIRPFLELEDDVLALRLLYENPAYMTVLPLYTVKKSIHEKSLAAVRVEDCKMSQFRQVIYHKNKVLTPQIQGMLDTIVEVAKRPF